MKLKEILSENDYDLIKGNIDVDIIDIVYDTRKIVPNCVFVCIKGSNLDSHDLIPEAIKNGAIAVIIENNIDVYEEVTVIKVKDTRKALALMSTIFFGNPSSHMCMIGITGTKGKTTTSYMIKSVLEENNKKVGIIGTIGIFIGNKEVKANNTTPESYELQRIFSEMVKSGCTHCVMEVSSQGLKQKRVEGIKYDFGIFTNLSEDHIGPTEHENMEEYLYYKSLLFKQSKIGLVNMDDEAYLKIKEAATCPLYTYGKNEKADLFFDNLGLLKEKNTLGLIYDVKGKIETKIKLGMPGLFNAYNSLPVLLISNLLNLDLDKTKTALKKVRVRGRLEEIHISEDYYVIIDYAHNERSVESLMDMIKDYNPKRIVCLFGGGGNRSIKRRYAMGEICGREADLNIITMDNPRDEEIKKINDDIKVGLKKYNANFIEIEDRKEAIYYALDNAQKGDYIILLGKGHETYQEIKGKKYHFSELEILNEYKEKM